MITTRTTAIVCVQVVSALLLSSCTRKANENFLGSAVVEDKTYQVATTAQGNLLAVYKQEGQKVTANELVAVVDTVPLVLRKEEQLAALSQLGSTIVSKQAEIKGIESDLAGIKREYDRISGLAEKGSVPQRDKDNLQTQLESARFRLGSSQSMLVSLADQQKGTRVRIDQVNNQIAECYVHAPASGMVLTRYRNLGEVVGPGNPIYEIGTFDTLYADFFVPQPVLASLKYGQGVRIRLDFNDPSQKAKEKFLAGAITWIGNEAEFSPKNIQTRESRNELVFRVRATIPNMEEILKRGLPVEVWR